MLGSKIYYLFKKALSPNVEIEMPSSTSETQTLEKYDLDALNRWFDERLEKNLREREEAKILQLALITTKCTMDMAYPPFILASTAAALGWEVSVFFTFYCLLLFYF